jgi:lactose/L-arabinose transport system substrate-binding protein
MEPMDGISEAPPASSPEAPEVSPGLPKAKAGKGKKFWIIVSSLVVLVIAAGVFGAWMLLHKDSSKTSTSTVKTVTDDPNTITVWSWNTAAKALKQLVPDFNKVYPNIKVNVVEIPYNEANAKYKTAVSTGVGFPDVMDTEGPVTPGYISSGALLDITSLAGKYQNDYVSYKWAEVTKDGKVYGLPWDSAPVGTFYRRDIFSAAGVNPDSIKTWDDYIAAGKKVAKDTNGDGKVDQYMTLMSSKQDVGDIFQTLLCEYGGSEYDTAGNATFNSPQATQAATLMKKIIDSGIASNVGWWTPEMYNGIKNGTIASLTTGVWMGGQIKDTAPALSGQWGVMPVPAVATGGVRSAVRGGSNLAITAKSKKADKAWKFIEFALANKDSQVKMYKNYDIFPALISTYSDPVFSQANAYFGNQNTSQLFITAQNTMPTTYHYGPYTLEANQILSAQMVGALAGQQTIDQALANTETKVNAVLKGTK